MRSFARAIGAALAFALLAPVHAGTDAAEAVKSLDARGAWVTDGNVMPVPNAPSEDAERETLRGISTRVFAERMEALIAVVKDAPGTME